MDVSYGYEGVETEEGKGVSELAGSKRAGMSFSKLTAYTRSRRSSTLYNAAKS